jgi:hypothetical protein
MILLKNPKNILILLFIALLLSFAFIIYRHNCSDGYCRQKIKDHSQIIENI